jgi:L-ribulokinase
MGSCESAAYVPDPARADAYDVLYAEYRALHDAFGPAGGALHRLRKIRNAALTAQQPARQPARQNTETTVEKDQDQ